MSQPGDLKQNTYEKEWNLVVIGKAVPVEVNGPIHLNEYETQNREKRYQLQVIAERTFSEKKKNQQDSSGNQNNAGQSSYPQPNDYGQYPTGPNGNQNGNGNSNYGYGNSGNSSQRGSYNNNRNGNNRQNAPHYNNQGSQPPQSGRTYNANGFQGNSQNGRNNSLGISLEADLHQEIIITNLAGLKGAHCRSFFAEFF